MSGPLLIAIVTAILGIVLGWLVPLLFRSERPYGLAGDILVCAILSAILAYAEAKWLLPALGFSPGWLTTILAIGDPLGFGLVGLWLMRKIKG